MQSILKDNNRNKGIVRELTGIKCSSEASRMLDESTQNMQGGPRVVDHSVGLFAVDPGDVASGA